jgi:hypothetical protein
MFSKKLLFTFVLSLFTLIYIYPQDEDSTEVENKNWEHHHHHHNFHFTFFNDEFAGKPALSINYGLSKVSLEDFNESFAKPNLIDLKIGYILDYNFKYFYVSNISADLANISSGSTDLKTDLWRFGFGNASGYGYKLGNAAIIPYYSYSLGWSKLRMEDTALTVNDKNQTDLYNETFRFSNSTEGGIRFQVIPNMSIDASYERSIIFPRHLFWKWTGSVLIEDAGQWAVDGFVDRVLDSAPYAAPIVSFVLKNALSYGMYELRHDKMNWPFDTVSPLAYDQFKVGLTFVL